MQCPSCKKNQPMSFRCRDCGAELVRRPGGVRQPHRTPAAPSPGPQAAAAAVALENPYQTPEVAAHVPVRASRAETLASRASRLSAQVVDGLLVLLIYIPIFFAAATGTEPDSLMWTAAMLATVAIVFILAGLQILYLTRDGQTIGKKALKIRIVRYDDGGNPGFVKAVLLRVMVNGFIGIIPGYPLIDILFIFGEEQRCIHDYLAGTKVVEA